MQKDIEYALGAIKGLPDDKQLIFKVGNDIGWMSKAEAMPLIVIELETSTVGHYEVRMWSRSGMDFEAAFPREVSLGLGLTSRETDIWWCIKFAHFEQDVYAMTKDTDIFFTL
jgi:hypothetical protein